MNKYNQLAKKKLARSGSEPFEAKQVSALSLLQKA